MYIQLPSLYGWDVDDWFTVLRRIVHTHLDSFRSVGSGQLAMFMG